LHLRHRLCIELEGIRGVRVLDPTNGKSPGSLARAVLIHEAFGPHHSKGCGHESGVPVLVTKGAETKGGAAVLVTVCATEIFVGLPRCAKRSC